MARGNASWFLMKNRLLNNKSNHKELDLLYNVHGCVRFVSGWSFWCRLTVPFLHFFTTQLFPGTLVSSLKVANLFGRRISTSFSVPGGLSHYRFTVCFTEKLPPALKIRGTKGAYRVKLVQDSLVVTSAGFLIVSTLRVFEEISDALLTPKSTREDSG